MSDRAEELRSCPDIWAEVAPHLDDAAEIAASYSKYYALDLARNGEQMRADMERKFRAGEQEHGRNWLNMSKHDLEHEIANEIRDLVIYHAMILARFHDSDSVRGE